MPHTVTFQRVLRAPAERVFRAFTDPDAMVKWLPPHGFTGRVHAMDARAGGSYRMSFTNLGTGHSHSFGGEFLEFEPGVRLRHTDRFDDPNLPGEMTTTITFTPVLVGTEIRIEQAGIPDPIPPRSLLPGLARVATAADIAGGSRDSGLMRTPR